MNLMTEYLYITQPTKDDHLNLVKFVSICFVKLEQQFHFVENYGRLCSILLFLAVINQGEFQARLGNEFITGKCRVRSGRKISRRNSSALINLRI